MDGGRKEKDFLSARRGGKRGKRSGKRGWECGVVLECEKGGMRRKGRGKKRKEYRVYWWSAFDTIISARTAFFPACQFILRVAIYPAQFLQRWRLGTFALCLAIKHFLIAHKCYQDFTEFYGPIWPKKCEKLRLCALKFPQANYKKRTTLCIAHCNLFCMHEVLLRKYYTKLHYIIL